ncbi:MAG TPA: DNA internalization-related competence protein ComEC/Rec2 [Clostridia bacterium]|nr:DNA internalization-related competence protein ComEC/Rec2 [Clostridia bacterium]
MYCFLFKNKEQFFYFEEAKLKNKRMWIFFIITLVISIIQMQNIENHRMECEKKYFGKTIKVEGVVDEEAVIKGDQASFEFRVTKIKINNTEQVVDFKILVKGTANEITQKLLYGNKILIGGYIQKPSGKRNPGAFDYRSYLMQSKIYGVMYFNRIEEISLDQKNTNPLKRWGIASRIKIINAMNQIPAPRTIALLKGILIGDTSDLDEETKKSFSDSGIAHIMSVSGTNITFLLIPLVFLFKKSRVHKKVYSLLIVIFLILYAFITGFSPPVARAVIMASVLLVAPLFNREADTYTALAFSAILIILLNPYTLLGASFQLSFAATLAILLFYKKIKGAVSKKIHNGIISSNMAATLSAQLGILPLSAIYFSNISIIGVLTNLLVMPLIPLISILGYIMIAIGQFWQFGALIIFQVLKYPTELVFLISNIMSKARFAIIDVPSFPIVFIIIYYVGLVFFIIIKPKYNIKVPIKATISLLIVVIVLTVSLNFKTSNLEIVILDAGQADCIFIKTPDGKNILIDSGENGDVVVAFLKYRAINKIDLLIGTHAHEDHIGGVDDLLQEVQVENMILPDAQDKTGFNEIMTLAANDNINLEYSREGDSLKVGDSLEFIVYNPIGNANFENLSLNNASLMLKLIYYDFTALFTGDCEKEVEDYVESKYSDDLKSDILKVGHHGSDTSTTSEFFKSVSPYAAIISVGKNKFGHPAQSVTNKIIQAGTQLYRTDKDGSVTINTDGYKMNITTAIRRN